MLLWNPVEATLSQSFLFPSLYSFFARRNAQKMSSLTFQASFCYDYKKRKRILAERMGRILFWNHIWKCIEKYVTFTLKKLIDGASFFFKRYLAICLRGCDWPVDHSFSCMFLASLNKYSLRTFMRLNAYNLKHLQLLKRLQLFWDLANSLFFVQSKACFTAAFIEWALFPIRTHGWQ